MSLRNPGGGDEPVAQDDRTTSSKQSPCGPTTADFLCCCKRRAGPGILSARRPLISRPFPGGDMLPRFPALFAALRVTTVKLVNVCDLLTFQDGSLSARSRHDRPSPPDRFAHR